MSTNDSILPPSGGESPPRPPAHVLVVDDDLGVAAVIAHMAQQLGHRTTVSGSVDDALARLAHTHFDVVLTDLRMPGRDGLELLEHVRAQNPDIPVVVITGQATIDSAMEAIKGGAYDYLAKPPQLQMLGALLRRAIEKKHMAEEVRHLQREILKHATAEDIVGKSPQMLEVYKTLQRVAESRTSVLVLGESGTGKELVARKLHERSPRRAERFVPVNVSAIPEGLLESELFGHVRGAFTGSDRDKPGRFELARGGTLFLDEIGTMRPDLQVKLLRVLQSRQVSRVGGTAAIPIDVRVVAASNEDLRAKVERGEFREDLFYRLNVFTLHLPPLRERREDIPILVSSFIQRLQRITGKGINGLTPNAMKLFMEYPWPGNVRELKSALEYAFVIAESGMVDIGHLPPQFAQGGTPAADRRPTAEGSTEKTELIEALRRTNGNQTRAARLLGINRVTVWNRMRKYGVDLKKGLP